MGRRIDAGQPSAAIATSPNFQETRAAVQEGHLHGQAVLPDPAGFQQDVAPKLLGRKMLKRQVLQHMALQRMMTVAKNAGQKTNEAAAARIAEAYEKLPDMPERVKLENMLAQLRGFQEMSRLEPKELAKKRKTEGEDDDSASEDDDSDLDGGAEKHGRRAELGQFIAGLLQNFDGDPSHQFAGYEILKAMAEDDDIDVDLVGAFSDIDRDFEAIGADVRAGYAAAQVAHEKAATLSTDPATVRNAYRTLIRTESSAAKLFDALSTFDPLKNCEAVMDTFVAIAGTDLSNLTGSSIDRTVLQAHLLELGKLKKLRGVLDGCAGLAAQVKPHLETKDGGKVDPVKLASSVLHLIEDPNPKPSALLRLPDQLMAAAA